MSCRTCVTVPLVQGNLIPQGGLKDQRIHIRNKQPPRPRKSNSPRGIEREKLKALSLPRMKVQGNLIPQGELKAVFVDTGENHDIVQGNLIPQGELKVSCRFFQHPGQERPRKSNSPRGIERINAWLTGQKVTLVQGNLIPQGELKASSTSRSKASAMYVQGNLIPQGELKGHRGRYGLHHLRCVQGNLIPQGELKVYR